MARPDDTRPRSRAKAGGGRGDAKRPHLDPRFAGPTGRKPKRGDQLEIRTLLDAPAKPFTWGGARRGAGRKPLPAAARRRPAHQRRPEHNHRHPVHLVMRARAGLASFREQRVHAMLQRVLEDQKKRAYREGFQVVHYSIQSNHLHIILEANDKKLVRSGGSGLAISFAKRLNKILKRVGNVWAERYHLRDLTSPRAVRNALVYVLQNVKKHERLVTHGGIVDGMSSARMFDGWTIPVITMTAIPPWQGPEPRTWFVRAGWKLHGLIMPSERPVGAPAPTTGRPMP